MLEITMTALLKQAKILDAWSRTFALISGILLAFVVLEQHEPSPAIALGVGLGFALIQAWFAVRASFDAAIFERITHPEMWTAFDLSLTNLGGGPAVARTPAARGCGALRLMKFQAGALLAQVACLLVAAWLACR